MTRYSERGTRFKRAELILTNPDGSITLMTYEQNLRAMGEQWKLQTTHKTGQYDVYERWGWLDAEQLTACGAEVPQDQAN